MDRYPEDERRSWLINEETAQWSILAELGRIRDRRGEEAFWPALQWVLEHRPRVKDAVLALRRYRTGEDGAPGADEDDKRLPRLAPEDDLGADRGRARTNPRTDYLPRPAVGGR